MASVSTRAAAICRPPLCTAPRLLERVITGRMQLAERYRHDEVCNTRWLWMVISAQINTHRRLKSSLAAQDLRLRGSSGFLLQPPMRVNLAKQPYGHPDVSLSSRALVGESLISDWLTLVFAKRNMSSCEHFLAKPALSPFVTPHDTRRLPPRFSYSSAWQGLFISSNTTLHLQQSRKSSKDLQQDERQQQQHQCLSRPTSSSSSFGYTESGEHYP